MNEFSSFAAFCAWLESLGMFHMDLGLDRIKNALDTFGLTLPRFPVIQVLGTNGKGSTSTFLSSLAASHGLKTGLFLSPHFISVRERIKINGQTLSEDLWLDCANRLKASRATGLTYFEFLTVLAMMIFDQTNVDLAIFEAGLGGKNDATSAIPAQIHCFTPIAMDHAKIIGPNLSDIAHDKALAIQKQSLVISSPQSPTVQTILEESCCQNNASIDFAAPCSGFHTRRLPGKSQRINSALALKCWRAFSDQAGIPVDEYRERDAIEKAFMPGRLQKIPVTAYHPALLLDGAHNPHAILSLTKNLEGKKPSAIIFSALADKDWPVGLEILDKFTGPIPMLIPAMENSRACDPELIKAQRVKRFPNASFTFHGENGFVQALNSASEVIREKNDYILITGSLYLLAEFFKLFPQYLEPEENF